MGNGIVREQAAGWVDEYRRRIKNREFKPKCNTLAILPYSLTGGLGRVFPVSAGIPDS